MSSPALTNRVLWLETSQRIVAGTVRGFHVLIESPCWLYLGTLTVMLFRPPDLSFYHLDRIAFLILVLVASLRALVLRQSLPGGGRVACLMLALLSLSARHTLSQPFDAEVWASLAARWLVPFAFYYIAQLIFQGYENLQMFETFCLVVLAYLSTMAIFFLLGMESLIFPSFILDGSLGIHADRARGPFLQAVANGVTINLLGLVALNAFRRGRLRGGSAFVLLAALPIAILATKTRAVWLSFAVAILAIFLVSKHHRLRQACLAIFLAGCGAGLLAVYFPETRTAFSERLADQSPVEFRESLYQAGWQMFLEKPAVGWNADDVQPEISKRISDFHPERFIFHNTYLDVAVAHGALGLVLYLWLFVELLRLGRQARSEELGGFLDSGFTALWPILLGVYALNACFVLMQYQFVNALLFGLAGMLKARNRRAAPASESF